MKIIGIILTAVIFIIFLVQVIVEAVKAIQYKTAYVCTGKVINSLGVQLVRVDDAQEMHSRKIYEKYAVEYEYNGEKEIGSLLTSRTGLREGALVEVHVKEKKGKKEILTELYSVRTGYRIFGLIFILIFVGLFLGAYML